MSTLKLMTYNYSNFQYNTKEAVMAHIEAENCDVICLQEMTNKAQIGGVPQNYAHYKWIAENSDYKYTAYSVVERYSANGSQGNCYSIKISND